MSEYLLERTLKERSPELHKHFTDTVFAMRHILSNYMLMFPEYSDHTELHSLTVVDFCNRLIGPEQIKKLTADEIYVLLMGCYLHDSGMGITHKEFESFRQQLDVSEFLSRNPRAEEADIIRDFHHEFSGMFIRKYSDFLEIPSPEHLFAVVQVSRGHRRTHLFDEQEYPADFKAPGGERICLPYLAALVRLADEIDVAAERNPVLLYDLESMQIPLQIWHSKMHKAIPELVVLPEAFVMKVDTEDEKLFQSILEMKGKMQRTLDYCREVTQMRSPFEITQESVEIQRIHHEQ